MRSRGGGARARERACVRQREGCRSALQAALGVPGNTELPGTVRNSPRPHRVQQRREETEPCPAGRGRSFPCRSVSRQRRLCVSPAAALAGAGCARHPGQTLPSPRSRRPNARVGGTAACSLPPPAVPPEQRCPRCGRGAAPRALCPFSTAASATPRAFSPSAPRPAPLPPHLLRLSAPGMSAADPI